VTAAKQGSVTLAAALSGSNRPGHAPSALWAQLARPVQCARTGEGSNARTNEASMTIEDAFL